MPAGWSLGIAPFVAKRNTPLDGSAFESIDVLDDRLARLRAAVKGRVTLRPTSPKWAWVEYRLAQGGFAAGTRRRAGRARRRPVRRLEGGAGRGPGAAGRCDAAAERSIEPQPASGSAAIASISIRAPLGRPAA